MNARDTILCAAADALDADGTVTLTQLATADDAARYSPRLATWVRQVLYRVAQQITGDDAEYPLLSVDEWPAGSLAGALALVTLWERVTLPCPTASAFVVALHNAIVAEVGDRLIFFAGDAGEVDPEAN
jgi:hypothetical protein